MSDDFLTRTYEARDAYLRAMGAVEDDVLAPAMNPFFLGGPRWPSLRQAWRVVRDGPRTIVVSDGLSDPFEGEEDAGLGLEILVETADLIDGPLAESWLFSAAFDVSQQAAYHGGLRELIDELGLISMEIRAEGPLQPLAGAEGMVGVLLGLDIPAQPREWALPGGSVRPVTAKVLTPAELAFIATGGAAAREELRRRFEGDGSHHRSSLVRESVV